MKIKATNPTIFLLATLLLGLSACSTTSRPRVVSTSERHPEIRRPAGVEDSVPDEAADSGLGESPAIPVQVGATNPAAESLVQQSVAAIRSQQYDSAEWHLEEAIRMAPGYGPAYYWMAFVKYQTRDLNSAASFINKARSLVPTAEGWPQRVNALSARIAGAH